MANLRRGLQPSYDGIQDRLDRVLWGLELLLDKAGVSVPDFDVSAGKPAPAAAGEKIVRLREPKRKSGRR